MDKIDRQLLHLIQKDATLTTAELADQVGLSASPCARRLKRLEQEGVIKRISSNDLTWRSRHCDDGVR